jgi:hypothetical protein
METNRSSGRPWSTRLCLPLVASSVLWATACASAGNAASSETPSSETPTSPSGSSVETRTYEGDGYSFAYPASWTPSQPATGLVEVLISAPPAARQDGILPNINVVLEPLRLELSTDQYYLASKQTVAGMFAGFELVDQGRTRIDGQLAWWMDYRWHSQGTAVRQRQAYQVRGDTGYVITFTASPSAFRGAPRVAADCGGELPDRLTSVAVGPHLDPLPRSRHLTLSAKYGISSISLRSTGTSSCCLQG